ncbi:MAG TPA: hypothetical protein VGR40_11915, partial [Candidatus Binatus sp.]|nr:hypothetical protein [Candidatus Binatus sp.]
MGQALVRFTQLLADGSFSTFQPRDPLRVEPQFHLIHRERRQHREHFLLARRELAWFLVDDPHSAKIETLVIAQRGGRIEADAEICDERMAECALVMRGVAQVVNSLRQH